MINEDTVKLLRECNAGVKMGVSAIDEVLERVQSGNLKQLLADGKHHHEQLGNRTRELLNEYHDSGKEPNPMAKGMSHIKTGIKIAIEDSDETIADLITDGCDMGVKSLSRYLNKYAAADEKSKNITKELITAEEQLSHSLRAYL